MRFYTHATDTTSGSTMTVYARHLVDKLKTEFVAIKLKESTFGFNFSSLAAADKITVVRGFLSLNGLPVVNSHDESSDGAILKLLSEGNITAGDTATPEYRKYIVSLTDDNNLQLIVARSVLLNNGGNITVKFNITSPSANLVYNYKEVILELADYNDKVFVGHE